MPATCPSLSLESTVNDVLHCHPETVRVFNAFGVDACCGGARPLREAARVADLLPGELLVAVESAIAAAARGS